MSEWQSVKDGLPRGDRGQYLIALPYPGYPTEWREAWWDGRNFVNPYPNAHGTRSRFERVSHYREIDDLPESVLSTREALREAIRFIELCERIGPVTDKLCSEPLLPRLRAALESE